MNAMISIRQRLAFDSTVALGIKVISLPLGCLTSLAVARFWGAQGLGVFTLAVYLVTTLSVVCRLGLDTGMVRFGAGLKAAGREGDIYALFWRGLTLVLCLSCVAGAGLFAMRGSFSPGFSRPEFAGDSIHGIPGAACDGHGRFLQ